ncbi:MAG: nicotinate-nucleotide adenylyltransferase [Eggerthellaceae bacterium]
MNEISKRFDTLGADGSPRRLGIMGGTFDPIHIGHLASADQACRAFDLDGVLFIPTYNPVFKLDQEVSDAALRLEMVRLATCSNEAFDVSDIEIKRGGKTFTADTLRELRKHFPDNVDFYFMVGADAAATLGKWRDCAVIASLAEIIVLRRPGYEVPTHIQEELESKYQFRLHFLDVTSLSVSSSDLRARVSLGETVRYLVSKPVWDFIEIHELYRGPSPLSAAQSEVSVDDSDVFSKAFIKARKEEIKQTKKPKLAKHMFRVAKTAREIAQVYGVDQDKAYLAGLLHDWDKTHDMDEMRRHIRDWGVAVDPYVYDHMPKLMHGPTAAARLSARFPQIPEDVLEAIARHTSAAIDMSSLDMVVYVADSIEPGRDYPGADDLRSLVGAVPLDRLFFEVFKHTLTYLLERNMAIYPGTFDVWNYYSSVMQDYESR